MTPMQQQYNELKKEFGDAVLLFRLGDFFEAFYDDAIQISKVLGITLTRRGKGPEAYPMAGIPHHALPNYLPKLVEANLKIAVAEQMEEAVPGKLVERKVTKVITPGTITDENSLDSSRNNYIASVVIDGTEKFTLSYADLTTGELRAFETKSFEVFKNEIRKINPSEILCSEQNLKLLVSVITKRFEVKDSSFFDLEKTNSEILNHFESSTLRGFGIENKNNIISSVGGLIAYLKECQKSQLKHIQKIHIYDYSNFMQLDSVTIRNLELIYPLNGSDESKTVYACLNECQNPMGKRKLREFILKPLINSEMLEDRFSVVDYFYKNVLITDELRENLRNMFDLERLTGKLGVGSANPKDLVALKDSLKFSIQIFKNLALGYDNLPKRLKHFVKIFTDASSIKLDFENIINLVETSLLDSPSVMLNDGNIIRDGYNFEIDELRNLKNNSRNILAQIQTREVSKTGISSLKISYNKVFGYYIEITKSHLEKVPGDYIRKQTLVNAERFITAELKELEEKIVSAEEKLVTLESRLFLEIREQVSKYIPQMLEASEILSEIDVLSNFGFIARKYQFTKPEILTHDDLQLDIKDGRHIVVERITNKFTPNSTDFESNSFIHILTGPNMSGKSTYIRQVALIVLLAQMGSFVPAASLKFNLADRIFTRVGASDNLAKGESTFMVEMIETANILNNATQKSLIILDEVGRGTSTYDGVAIAWSVLEYVYNNLKCRTLFATHYHELVNLEEKYKGIKNFNVLVKEDGEDIVFMHKIGSGGTDKSYGVHVAKLAGVPKEVVERANAILKEFEAESKTQNPKSKIKNQEKNIDNSKPVTRNPKRIHPEQMGLI